MDFNYWINTKDYAVSGLLWNGIGCLFWVITYLALVVRIIKRKYVEMPFFIASGNFAWEFVWSFFFHPNTGRLFSLSYQCAFILDIFIFMSVLKYGNKQIELPEIKRIFKFLATASLIIWLPLNYFFVIQGFDTPIGANSGFILNLIISILYPFLMLRSNVQNFSRIIAWCKWLGTGFITVSMFIFYPNNYFVQTLGISCFVIDLLYAILLTVRRRHELMKLNGIAA